MTKIEMIQFVNQSWKTVELAFACETFILQLIMFNWSIGNPFNYFPPGTPPISVDQPQSPPPENKLVQDHQKLKEKYKKLKHQYALISQENKKYKEEIFELEKICTQGDRKKVKRRMESQLEKNHQCPYPTCKKEYASVVALNLHIRIKHKGGTKKQRVSYLKACIDAESQGKELPLTTLQLPQEVIDYQMQFLNKKSVQQSSSSRSSQQKAQRFEVPSVSIENLSPQ